MNLTEEKAASIIQSKYREHLSQKPDLNTPLEAVASALKHESLEEFAQLERQAEKEHAENLTKDVVESGANKLDDEPLSKQHEELVNQPDRELLNDEPDGPQNNEVQHFNTAEEATSSKDMSSKEEEAARIIQLSYRKHLSKQVKQSEEVVAEETDSDEPVQEETAMVEPVIEIPVPKELFIEGSQNSLCPKPEEVVSQNSGSPPPFELNYEGEELIVDTVKSQEQTNSVADFDAAIEGIALRTSTEAEISARISADQAEFIAASKIQHHYRQHRTVQQKKEKLMKYDEKIREEKKAVGVIEKNYVKYKTKRDKIKMETPAKNRASEEHNAATKIQRKFRDNQRKTVQAEEAVTAIEPVETDEVVAELQEEGLDIKRNDAAIKIQRQFRQHKKDQKADIVVVPPVDVSPKLKSLEMRKNDRKKSKANNQIQSDTLKLKTLKKSAIPVAKRQTKKRDIEDLEPDIEQYAKSQEELPQHHSSEEEPELAGLCDISTAEVLTGLTSSSEEIPKSCASPQSHPLESYYQEQDMQIMTVHDRSPSISDYESYTDEESFEPTPKPQGLTTFATGTLDGYAVRNLLKKTLPPPSTEKKAPDSYLQQFLKKIDGPKKAPFRTGRTPKPHPLVACKQEQPINQGYQKNVKDNLNSQPLPNLEKIAGYGRLEEGYGRLDAADKRKNGYNYRPVEEKRGPAKGITRGGYYPVIPAYGRLKENEIRKQKNTELQEIPWPTDH